MFSPPSLLHYEELPEHEVDRRGSNYESFDYDEHTTLIRQNYLRGRSDRQWKRDNLWRWTLTLLIAIATAVICFTIRECCDLIAETKFAHAQRFLNDNLDVTAAAVFIAVNMVLVGMASLLVSLIEPIAGGSGIPEIKCSLNGIKVPRLVRFKTLLVKGLGMIGTVAGGLPAGSEGPMIHSGAICAAGLSQGKSTTLPILHSNKRLFKRFRNDREKRDFISCGAAAGVACAFGAPIGGVMFTLEEGSSFWNLGLTWRSFFCAMTAAFFYELVENHLGTSGMFMFGSDLNTTTNYRPFEVVFFIAIGVLGGLLGALYNHLNKKLTMFRMKRLSRPHLRIMEALAVSFVISLSCFILPFFFGTCLDDSPTDAALGIGSTRQFKCPKGSYNDFATLFFNTSDMAIRQLLHSTQSFSYQTLIVFVIPYFFFSCITYGLSVPGGLFVPNLLAGAAMGRFIGQGLQTWINVHPGTYALVGAAAMLGGMARMTISLTVILIESTGNISLGLPIMVTLLTTKLVGDFFNDGLYDIHIHLKGFYFLHWHPPDIANYLLAMDVMNTELECFGEIETVGRIYKTLLSCTHHGFPVIDRGSSKHGRYFRGLVLRKHLTTILKRRAFHKKPPVPYETPPDLTYDDVEGMYPRYPKIEDIEISESMMSYYVDLTPYMNPSPYVTQEHAPVSHAYNLFRTMGSRHLCVVNKNNEVVGMITRKDLIEDKFRNQLDTLLSPTGSVGSQSEHKRRDSNPYMLVKNLDCLSPCSNSHYV